MDAGNNRKPLFQISHESLQLIGLLRTVEVGAVVEYSTMNELISGDVQDTHRHVLCTARRRLMQDEEVHFGTIIRLGIRRLTESEATESLDLDISKIRSGARRVHRKTQLIKLETLSPAERLKLAMTQTLSAVISKSTTSRSQQRLLDAGGNVSLKKAFAALSGEG